MKLQSTAKGKRGRRSRKDWDRMTARELTYLMANRVARIEVLKMEIKTLQRMIDSKIREG